MAIFRRMQKASWGKSVGLVMLSIGLVMAPGTGSVMAKQYKGMSPERPVYSGYPVDFSGRGHIDRIGDGEIVIDDGLFKVNSAVRFNRPNRLGTSMSSFSAGEKIGFIVDKEGNLKSVWLLKKGKK